MGNRNKKMSTSNKSLIFIVIAVVIYTVAAFVVQYLTGTEISPTLTEQFFRVFCVELIALTTIKVTKVRNNYSNDEEIQEEFIEEGVEE